MTIYLEYVYILEIYFSCEVVYSLKYKNMSLPTNIYEVHEVTTHDHYSVILLSLYKNKSHFY